MSSMPKVFKEVNFFQFLFYIHPTPEEVTMVKELLISATEPPTEAPAQNTKGTRNGDL